MLNKLIVCLLVLSAASFAQHTITIDGNFDDWLPVTTVVYDSAHDEHDTDWFSDGLPQPVPRKYADVDILEAKFTHDRDNLYGYVKARGVVGRTSSSADGHKAGRYYYIITIDVDNNDSTGYPIEQGNYWPNSRGYDVNMEVEFYNGAFNTGHYILHSFMNDAELAQGRIDLQNRVCRLAPGDYDHYTQWVVFPDSSIVEVSDKGPVYQGIIEVAVSPDGHEAEMKAPMWGFFKDETGEPLVALGKTLDISFSLEGSGELSESAIEAGYNGTKSVWGSDTAEPIVGYKLEDLWTTVEKASVLPHDFTLKQNYPNPFNPSTVIEFSLHKGGSVVLDIFDINGRHVRRLVNADLSAGAYRNKWDGRSFDGMPVAPGLYLATLRTASESRSIKMLYVK